jgi:hypothetical protein
MHRAHDICRKCRNRVAVGHAHQRLRREMKYDLGLNPLEGALNRVAIADVAQFFLDQRSD